MEEEEYQEKNATETIIPKKFNQMKMNPRAWGQSGPKNTEDIEEEDYQEKNSTETIIPKKFAKKFNQMKMKPNGQPKAWGQSGPKNTEDMEEKPSNSTILPAQFNPFEPK